MPFLTQGNFCCWYIIEKLLYHSGCSFWLHGQFQRFVICGTHLCHFSAKIENCTKRRERLLMM